MELEQTKEQIIIEICERIKFCKTAIFCGAGISYNSGLPLANDLIKYILKILNVEESDAELILNSNLPFEAFIEILKNEVNIDCILDIFDKGAPNTNHEFIASLVNKGLIKTILTTNFDRLIEKSLFKIGLTQGIHYKVYSTEKEFGELDWESDIVKIIKIHGCITNKKEMAITLKFVAQSANVENKNKIISAFFSKFVNPNILVLGYSCSDLFDISPQIESIVENKSQIILLEHVISTSYVAKKDISIQINKNPFNNFHGDRISINVDILIEDLWNNILRSNYKNSTSKILWKGNIDNWIKETVKYSNGITNQISATLLYNIGEYKRAIKIWEESLSIAKDENNKVFFYSQIGNIGMALNAIADFSKAKTYLEESVIECEIIGNVQGEISQLQALGNVYLNLNKFDDAVIVFNKAILLSEQYESNSLCSCLGNLSTVYNKINDYERAIVILKKGLPLAIAIGNKQSEASMLNSFAIAYFKKGEYEKAFDFSEKSIIITRQMGDKQGECMSILNMANLFCKFKDYEKCLEYSKLALEIAKDIGLKQGEAGAYYNIGISYLLKEEQELSIMNFKKSIDISRGISGVDD